MGPTPKAFAWRSARWLAAALAGLGLVWLLGFEAVLYRAAPLHARPDAVLEDLRVLPSVVLLALLAALVLRRTAVSPALPVPRLWTAVCAAGMAALVVAWAGDPKALPLVAYHALAIAVFAAGAGALLNAAAFIGLPAHEPGTRPAWRMVAGITVFAFVFAGSLAMIRGGPDGIEALAAQPPLSYVDDLDKTGTPYALFRDFAGMHPVLSNEAQARPPGALLLAWTANVLAGESPFGIVLTLMVLASLAVIPLYGWVAAMASRRAALIAAMLYAVVPGVTLFAAGSVDAAFAPFTLSALLAFARAQRNHSLAWALVAGGFFACATLMHFALVTLAYWFMAAGMLHATRDGTLKSVLRSWLGLVAGALAVHTLFAATGYNYLDNFRLAWESIHAHPADAPRAAWYWWPPLTALALTFYAGIPVCLLTLGAVRALPAPARALARCGAFVFACVALTYLGAGEGERAAYHAYPFLVLPAALMLDHAARRDGSLALTATAMGLCAVQAWIMQAYFEV